MGKIFDFKNGFSVELRRESFIIHAPYGYKLDGNHATGSFAESWRDNPNPEFKLQDLNTLIDALAEFRDKIEATAAQSPKDLGKRG